MQKVKKIPLGPFLQTQKKENSKTAIFSHLWYSLYTISHKRLRERLFPIKT